MASRTSGGWFIAGSIPISKGIDPLKYLLDMSVGNIPDENLLIPKTNFYCSQRYWIPKEKFTFLSTHEIEKIKEFPGVKMFEHFFPKPGTIVKKAENHAQRFAQVICIGSSRDEARNRSVNAIKSIKINYEK